MLRAAVNFSAKKRGEESRIRKGGRNRLTGRKICEITQHFPLFKNVLLSQVKNRPCSKRNKCWRLGREREAWASRKKREKRKKKKEDSDLSCQLEFSSLFWGGGRGGKGKKTLKGSDQEKKKKRRGASSPSLLSSLFRLFFGVKGKKESLPRGQKRERKEEEENFPFSSVCPFHSLRRCLLFSDPPPLLSLFVRKFLSIEQKGKMLMEDRN